ncbi:NADP-dependent oxidoreductase domain-containing protein [Lactifluus subvellereus]|nr:NADP-dependent oxidoreductase domain-containing protein [Lactifluus subvellereus]
MGVPLDSPEELITFPPIDTIPDGPEDQPTPGPLLEEKFGPLNLPELISGAATWSHFYNDEDKLVTDVPLRTIRLALRYGIRAFDTAPFYDNSEIVLGTALKALEPEFPRGAYQLITKVGRYGPADFDYSPDALRRSVRRSLQRLHTQYLDVVYLHDVEFVVPCVAPRAEGNHESALGAEAAAYGVAPDHDAAGISGARGSEGEGESEGDERILAAISTLRALQADGLIRHVGICGLPLPALLRTALLVLERTGRPLDAVQTYAHLTLQNATLRPFAAALRARARVAQVLAASPLGMGLLLPPPAPPAWHPAPDAVRAAAREAVLAVGPEEVAAVAVAWSVRAAWVGGDGGSGGGAGRMPVVVGMSNLREVHAAVAAWRWARDEGRQEELEGKAALAQGVFERTGTAGWTWASGNWA